MPFGRNAKTKKPLDEAALYGYAVKALGRHMRTEAELHRLMAARAEPEAGGEAAVRRVIARLKEHGYLNDRTFAETYARLRQENEKLGARRVRQDLRQKGVRAELVEEAVAARYGETSEEALQFLWLAKTLYPARFADIDMREETRGFYRDFFGLSLTAAQIDAILNPPA